MTPEEEYFKFLETHKASNSLSMETLFLLWKLEKLQDEIDRIKYILKIL